MPAHTVAFHALDIGTEGTHIPQEDQICRRLPFLCASKQWNFFFYQVQQNTKTVQHWYCKWQLQARGFETEIMFINVENSSYEESKNALIFGHVAHRFLLFRQFFLTKTVWESFCRPSSNSLKFRCRFQLSELSTLLHKSSFLQQSFKLYKVTLSEIFFLVFYVSQCWRKWTTVFSMERQIQNSLSVGLMLQAKFFSFGYMSNARSFAIFFISFVV